jgi:hypothetical protein
MTISKNAGQPSQSVHYFKKPHRKGLGNFDSLGEFNEKERARQAMNLL